MRGREKKRPSCLFSFSLRQSPKCITEIGKAVVMVMMKIENRIFAMKLLLVNKFNLQNILPLVVLGVCVLVFVYFFPFLNLNKVKLSG